MENVKSGYKRAVDWIHFLMYSLPATVASRFHKVIRDNQQPKESTMMLGPSLYTTLMVRS